MLNCKKSHEQCARRNTYNERLLDIHRRLGGPRRSDSRRKRRAVHRNAVRERGRRIQLHGPQHRRRVLLVLRRHTYGRTAQDDADNAVHIRGDSYALPQGRQVGAVSQPFERTIVHVRGGVSRRGKPQRQVRRRAVRSHRLDRRDGLYGHTRRAHDRKPQERALHRRQQSRHRAVQA